MGERGAGRALGQGRRPDDSSRALSLGPVPEPCPPPRLNGRDEGPPRCRDGGEAGADGGGGSDWRARSRAGASKAPAPDQPAAGLAHSRLTLNSIPSDPPCPDRPSPPAMSTTQTQQTTTAKPQKTLVLRPESIPATQARTRPVQRPTFASKLEERAHLKERLVRRPDPLYGWPSPSLDLTLLPLPRLRPPPTGSSPSWATTKASVRLPAAARPPSPPPSPDCRCSSSRPHHRTRPCGRALVLAQPLRPLYVLTLTLRIGAFNRAIRDPIAPNSPSPRAPDWGLAGAAEPTPGSAYLNAPGVQSPSSSPTCSDGQLRTAFPASVRPALRL